LNWILNLSAQALHSDLLTQFQKTIEPGCNEINKVRPGFSVSSDPDKWEKTGVLE